jgi:hypothetical protein
MRTVGPISPGPLGSGEGDGSSEGPTAAPPPRARGRGGPIGKRPVTTATCANRVPGRSPHRLLHRLGRSPTVLHRIQTQKLQAHAEVERNEKGPEIRAFRE